MEAVTKYQANDGRVFDTEGDALSHEAKIICVSELSKLLHPTPKNDGCSFDNGGGYVQQDAVKVQEYKRQIMLLGAPYHEKFTEWAKNPIAVHPQSIVGRILCDCDDLLYRAWYRVMCMDEQFREWGQPYFANNPHEGKQIDLTPPAH